MFLSWLWRESLVNADTLMGNKNSWNEAADRFYGRNPLPEYGPLAPTEDELQLLGDVTGQKVLEIGCGSGHSLLYMDRQNAGELWGLDLSTKQIENARDLLQNSRASVKLFESPMEEDPGLPQHYFDLVFSVFAIGWTVDLDQTLANVHRYLKQGGTFVFSWEHPLYNRVIHQNGVLQVAKSYHEEGSYDHEAWSQTAIMQQYRLSTFINACIRHGFSIERVVEDVALSDEVLQSQTNSWYSAAKASAIPTTMIIKCVKK
jgi:ubiquinone/menaquinone biosynthesis C-methylase UbiE